MTRLRWPLQTAVYGVLTADADLTAVAGVYDHVPAGAPMPYVVLGDSMELPDNAHDRKGVDGTINLHIWSDYDGYRDVALVHGHLDRLLDRQPITIDGHQNVTVFTDNVQYMTDDADPAYRHGVIRYRVWAEQT